jgi:hypothetical protein
MKKAIHLLMLLLAAATSAIAQAQDKTQIIDPAVKVTWLGLDFTGVKFIGDRERLGSMSDVKHLMEAWNSVLETENEKYNPGRAIGRRNLNLALEVTKEHNANLELIDVFSNNKQDHQHLTASDVDQIISGYDFKGNPGIGLIYIVDSFSKLDEEGAIWVTFVDMDSNKVIYTEKMIGPPGGFGMRNFWAKSVFVVTEKLKKEFLKWKKK